MCIYIYIYIYICICICVYISGISLGRVVHPTNAHPEKLLKFLALDALIIHTLLLSVFCFLFKNFSKLLKFTLRHTVF